MTHLCCRMRIRIASITEIKEGRKNFLAGMKSCTGLLPFKPTALDLRDCCDGLILFASGSVPKFYVCNPKTKESVSIPEAPPDYRQSADAVLAFNRCEALHYRLVKFVYSAVLTSVSNPPGLDIFSSETREWVTHIVPVEPPVAYGAVWVWRCVYLDGVLYRLSESKHLLHFDLKKDAAKAWAIELPEKARTDEYGSMGVSMGCFDYANHDRSRLLTWLLKDRRKTAEWILKHIIPFHELMKHSLASLSICFRILHGSSPMLFIQLLASFLLGFLSGSLVMIPRLEMWKQFVP